MKLSTLTIIFDVSSFICGVVGIVLGIYSLLALNSSWNNPTLSYKLTLIAIIFDIFSCLFALLAFKYGYKHFLKRKEKFNKFKKNSHNLEVKAIIWDFISFCLGVIGLICEALSLLALLPMWNNLQLSYNITVGAVVFDIFSCLVVFIALLITIVANRKSKNISLSPVK